MQNLPFPILWCRCLSLPATRHGWRKIITLSLDIPFLSCYNTYRSVEPNRIWGYSSAGRALEWHSRGQRFDPAYLHQNHRKRLVFGGFFVFCVVFRNGAKLCSSANWKATRVWVAFLYTFLPKRAAKRYKMQSAPLSDRPPQYPAVRHGKPRRLLQRSIPAPYTMPLGRKAFCAGLMMILMATSTNLRILPI